MALSPRASRGGEAWGLTSGGSHAGADGKAAGRSPGHVRTAVQQLQVPEGIGEFPVAGEDWPSGQVAGVLKRTALLTCPHGTAWLPGSSKRGRPLPGSWGN